MLIGMAIIWVAVIVLVVWLVRSLMGPSRDAARSPARGTVGQTPPVAPFGGEDPVAVVKRRYAAGEIDPEEYLQKLCDLGAPPTAGA
jgi:uncharacterized membrane protein